jgi:hypothetical protein
MSCGIGNALLTSHLCTEKKKNFLIYKGNQSGAVAKSYIWKGFLIYEELRKYFPIFEKAVSHTVYDFATACSILNFLLYEENLIWFLSVCNRALVLQTYRKSAKFINGGSGLHFSTYLCNM